MLIFVIEKKVTFFNGGSLQYSPMLVMKKIFFDHLRIWLERFPMRVIKIIAAVVKCILNLLRMQCSVFKARLDAGMILKKIVQRIYVLLIGYHMQLVTADFNSAWKRRKS